MRLKPNSYKIAHYQIKHYNRTSQLQQNINSFPQYQILFSFPQYPNSYKITHFQIKNYNLHFTTAAKYQFFPTVPHTFFSTKICTTFNFIEFFTCAIIIQNSTNHDATLRTGHIVYTEVAHTNHSDITEQVPPKLFFTIWY